MVTVNLDLINALDGLKGTTEKKQEKIGDFNFEYGMEKYGVFERR